MHYWVADKRAVKNMVRTLVCLGAYLNNQTGYRFPDGNTHLFLTARVHHHIRHTTHQIFAKSNLRVHSTGRGDCLPTCEIHQMSRNSGGPDIHCESERALMESWPYGNDFFVAIDGNRDLPIAFPHSRLQVF